MGFENNPPLKNNVVDWDDAHQYSPAPRHRRRIILNIINDNDFETCLDAGCAQPYMLEILYSKGKKLYGCDISDEVIISNRARFKNASFEEVDISKETYPGNRQFDLIICSEVLEHIPEWKAAIKNMSEMTKKYLLITVPGGKVHKIDRMVGHIRHFGGQELKEELIKNGLSIILNKRWGFPFHSLYKYAINSFGSDRIYENFARREYGIFQRTLSKAMYYLFFVNDIFNYGSQLFILARKN